MKHQNNFPWLAALGMLALLLVVGMMLTGRPAYAGFTPTPTPTNTPTPLPTATPTFTPPPPQPPVIEATPIPPTPMPLLPESGGNTPPFWTLWVLGAAALLLGWILRAAASRRNRLPR